MSLAPTLQTELNVLPGAGVISTAGLALAIFTNVITPIPGQLLISGQFSGLAPTVVQTAGPNAAPGVGLARFNPLTPTLQSSLTVYPELPATPSNDNNLGPTILLGTSDAAGTPNVGYVSIAGNVPTLLRDNAAFAFIGAPSAIVLGGLQPTVSVPAGQEGTATPRLGNLQTAELAPSILGELNVSAGLGGIVITGLTPTLVYAAGWETVAISGAAVWTDVPRAS